MKIEGRTFIVSGGSSGLGLATVQMLVQAKSYVSILDREPPPSDIIGAQVKFFPTDITVINDIEKAVDETVNWTKQTGAALGGVINCAGVAAGAKIIDAQNEPHSLDLWDFVLAVNLTGTFNLTRLALKHMVHNEPEEGPDAERGVIVLVSSSAAFEGQPGQAAYSATKGALRSMAMPLARDLARHSIRVMAIAPNMFVSSMTDKLPQKARRSLEGSLVYPKRFGQPFEFAQTVKWILQCAYVNGETVRLSGASRMPAKM
ncbi:3-hydroxyacyl-CoA dehydrogenase [Lentinula aff. lateritia]|uniref:3-hydroxyacyl-CoA dehydrogenase n=1 Tax=Lentinula aff. lateritia TaxID=2804960 RepID=A0ACC1U8N5_9AGAR|nr:3-hydroxyacyl-CoA dehydrogenase [Lentinula aff. lateritia]